MDAPCPAPEVQGTLVEQLAVAGWEEVGGEEDKRVGSHQEGMLYTPPPVIVETLVCIAVECWQGEACTHHHHGLIFLTMVTRFKVGENLWIC